MLKEIDQKKINTDDSIRLGIIDSQISSILYNYGQDISPEIITDLLYSSFKLGMFQTSGFFEFVISRTNYVTNFTIKDKLQLLKIISSMRKDIKDRGELDFTNMVEKMYLEVVLGLKQQQGVAKRSICNIEVLSSLLQIEKMRRKDFAQVELEWFSSELDKMIKSGQMEQIYVESEEDGQIYRQLKNLVISI